MSAPLTKPFLKSPITKELEIALMRIGKTLKDVQYVKYTIAHSNYTGMNTYYCDIDDFISATKLATSMFDINWPHDVVVVGEKFWIDYDYHGVWYTHVPPHKPEIHRKPSSQDILRET